VLAIFAELNEVAKSLAGVGLGKGEGSGLTGRSSILHFLQRPFLFDVTSGCIGHEYTTRFAVGLRVD
jgi:hypothetical protein